MLAVLFPSALDVIAIAFAFVWDWFGAIVSFAAAFYLATWAGRELRASLLGAADYQFSHDPRGSGGSGGGRLRRRYSIDPRGGRAPGTDD